MISGWSPRKAFGGEPNRWMYIAKRGRELKALPLLASPQLPQKCHNGLVQSRRKSGKSVLAQLFFNRKEVAKRNIDNTCRENTLLFQFPGKRNFYNCSKFQKIFLNSGHGLELCKTALPTHRISDAFNEKIFCTRGS